MNDFNTVEDPKNINPLDKLKNEDVSKMQTSLLSCNACPSVAAQSLRQVMVLRIYHQLARIIKYTELMDKLEDKLYSSIETAIVDSDDTDDTTWVKLITIQEKLQKNMIESQKLLQPMMDLDLDTITTWMSSESDIATPDLILDASSREHIRSSAQAVLLQLNADVG